MKLRKETHCFRDEQDLKGQTTKNKLFCVIESIILKFYRYKFSIQA